MKTILLYRFDSSITNSLFIAPFVLTYQATYRDLIFKVHIWKWCQHAHLTLRNLKSMFPKNVKLSLSLLKNKKAAGELSMSTLYGYVTIWLCSFWYLYLIFYWLFYNKYIAKLVFDSSYEGEKILLLLSVFMHLISFTYFSHSCCSTSEMVSKWITPH